MPKSRKRATPKKKSRKSNPKPYQVVKQKLVKMEIPLPKDIPLEKKIEVLHKLGEKASVEAEETFQKLVGYFGEYDPLYLCSFCSRYFATSAEGIDEEAIHGSLDFHLYYLEVLQCISLTFERHLSGKPLDENIVEFKATIKNLCYNQGLAHLKLAGNIKSQDDVDAVMLRSEMMGQTMAVRNWAYANQMQSIAYDLADLAESNFSQSQGFKLKHILDIIFALGVLTQDKLNIHIQKTRNFVRAKNYTEVYNRYEASFPNVEKTGTDDRMQFWNIIGKNLMNLKCALLVHSDCFLPNIYTHDLIEIHEFLDQEIPIEEISEILNKMSLKFGELSGINKDHIFLNNPVHAKPFIKITDTSFFSVIPHMFSHLGVDLIEGFIANDAKLKREYASKKGKFLETRVEQLFRDAFPDAQILPGSIWHCPATNKDFENDLIVLIEDFAIIVECKSGTISPPARRGAPDRLFKTLQELIIAPSQQAIRFESYLKQNREIHEFRTKTGIANIVDSTKIKYYVPLGITLSNLGSIGCNLKKLIRAKITDLKLGELAPSISLTDLEVIFEILTLKSEKIHYLSRRREVDAHLNFQGDEMDLFGFYLENGFNIGEAEYNESGYIDLTLKSKEIDPYFVGKQRGKKIKKPSLRKTKYWNDILNTLECRSQNWLMASYILLNLPKEDQIQFQKNLKLLVKNISQGKCPDPHNWMVLYCGPERRTYAIVGFPYKGIDRKTRNALINKIISSFEAKENLRGVVLLGYDLDVNLYPYSVVAGRLKTDFFDDLELDQEIGMFGEFEVSKRIT